MILSWNTFMVTLGHMWLAGLWLDTPTHSLNQYLL